MKKSFVSILFFSFLILLLGGQNSFAATTINPIGDRIIPIILSAEGRFPSVQTGAGLFDNTRVNEWDSGKVFYWNDASDFIELQINSDFRIWRSGTTTWSTQNGKLKTEQWNGSAYIDISSTQPTPTAITQNQWELNTTDLPAGKYKFTYSAGYRLDSEWYVEQISPPAPSNLTGQAGSAQVTLVWDNQSSATLYNIKRSTTQGGPYTSIASVTDATYFTDTNVTKGTTYYYVVSSVGDGGESADSNEVSVTIPNNPLLDVIIAEEQVTVGQEVIADIALKNVSNIYAEDFTVAYDKTLFDYVGFEEVPGYKVYNAPVDQNGQIRFIVASQGQNYGINSDTTFVKIKLKAKAAGTGKLDAIKCRIADINQEYDLNGASCTEDSVLIEGVQDVNKSGEYTLLDLAIDAYYYGQPASNADPVKYNADQAGDEFVTNEDLVYIVNQMLANTNYQPNN